MRNRSALQSTELTSRVTSIVQIDQDSQLSRPASFFRAVGFFAMLQKIGPCLLAGQLRSARQTSAEPKEKRNCVEREREREREREIALEA